jgi:S-adenosylmethionine/arginine decarboxylase-like enzyme
MIKKISNVSTTLIVNTYDCFYYSDEQDIASCQNKISKKYNSTDLLDISRKISQTIQTEILHESSHNFEPFGDSGSLLIQADLKLYNSAALHLKESHITFHTYIEDIFEHFAIVRLEYHISSCSDANVYNALKDIVLNKNNHNIFPDLVSVDFIRRGAKYGNTHEDILYDTNTWGFENFDKYEISSVTQSLNTEHHTFLLEKDSMVQKYQSEHNFFPIDKIEELRSFLLSSYSDSSIDLNTFDKKSSKNS